MGNSCMREDHDPRIRYTAKNPEQKDSPMRKSKRDHGAYGDQLEANRNAMIESKQRRNEDDLKKVKAIKQEISELQKNKNRSKQEEFELKKLQNKLKVAEKMISNRKTEINHIQSTIEE